MQIIRVAAVGLVNGEVPETFATTDKMEMPLVMHRAKKMRERWKASADWHGVFELFVDAKAGTARLLGSQIQRELEVSDGGAGIVGANVDQGV